MAENLQEVPAAGQPVMMDMSDAISVTVDACDFAEEHFCVRIGVRVSIPPLLGDFAEVSRSPAASATAVLKYATMGTNM